MTLVPPGISLKNRNPKSAENSTCEKSNTEIFLGAA